MKHTKESLMKLVHGIAGYLTSKEQVEAALDEVFDERDELLAACKLFIEYDSCGSDDGFEMMATYAAAIEASKAAIAKAEGVAA